MWTYEARIDRVCSNLIDSARVDRVDTYKRAKFFGRHSFRVSIAISLQQWVEFDQLIKFYREKLEPLGAHVVGVSSTFDVHIYASDPSVLTWIYRRPSIQINSLALTDPAYWDSELPVASNPGKFYGEYRFRIRMRDALWGVSDENVDRLEELELDYKIVLRKWNHSLSNEGSVMSQVRDTFIYVRKLNEVLVLKLVLGDQVADVEDRS